MNCEGGCLMPSVEKFFYEVMSLKLERRLCYIEEVRVAFLKTFHRGMNCFFKS